MKNNNEIIDIEFKVKSEEDLLINTSKNIYYMLETYQPNSLVWVERIKFNENIKLTSQLPETIQYITFHHKFDNKINIGILPIYLKYLDLGINFNHPITDDILPDSTEKIIFGHAFNQNLLIKPRNLKKIIVQETYNKLVSSDILHLMPESYRNKYPIILKNNPIIPERCRCLHNENNLVTEFSVEDLENEIDLINYAIAKYFNNARSELNNKNIFLNNKNQIVIDLRFSFYDHNHVIFVGNNCKYFRTYFEHAYYFTDGKEKGPFNILEIIKQLREYD